MVEFLSWQLNINNKHASNIYIFFFQIFYAKWCKKQLHGQKQVTRGPTCNLTLKCILTV